MLEMKRNSKVTYWNLERVHSFLGFFHMDHSIFFLESFKTLTIHLFMFKFQKRFHLFNIHFLFSGFIHHYHSLFWKHISLVLTRIWRKLRLVNVFNLPRPTARSTNMSCMNFSIFIFTTCTAAVAAVVISSSHLCEPFLHRVWHILGTFRAQSPKGQNPGLRVSPKRSKFWYWKNREDFM